MLRALLVPIITVALLSGSPVSAKGDGNGDKGGGNAGSGGQGGEDGGAASPGNGRSAGEGESRGNDARGGDSHPNGNSGKSGGAGQEGGSALGGQGSASSSRSGDRQSDRSSGSQVGGDLGGEGRAAGSQSNGNSSLGSRSSNSISGKSDPAPASLSTSTTDRLDTISPSTMPKDPIATNTVQTITPLNIEESNNEATLPLSLAPRFDTRNFTQTGVQGSILPRGSIPIQIVQICRNSIIRAAVPYGAVRVDAASAGQLNRTRGGGLMAPIEVRVAYTRATVHQIRQSRISCHLNAAGAVVGLRG
jgi:hypothetical protein